MNLVRAAEEAGAEFPASASPQQLQLLVDIWDTHPEFRASDVVSYASDMWDRTIGALGRTGDFDTMSRFVNSELAATGASSSILRQTRALADANGALTFSQVVVEVLRSMSSLQSSIYIAVYTRCGPYDSLPVVLVRELCEAAGVPESELPLLIKFLETIGAVERLGMRDQQRATSGKRLKGDFIVFDSGDNRAIFRVWSPQASKGRIIAELARFENGPTRLADTRSAAYRHLKDALEFVSNVIKSEAESLNRADWAARERIPEPVRHEVWRRDQGQCVQCGSRLRLEFDHIIPLSKGGSNSTRNIQLLCEACNRAKSDSI